MSCYYYLVPAHDSTEDAEFLLDLMFDKGFSLGRPWVSGYADSAIQLAERVTTIGENPETMALQAFLHQHFPQHSGEYMPAPYPDFKLFAKDNWGKPVQLVHDNI